MSSPKWVTLATLLGQTLPADGLEVRLHLISTQASAFVVTHIFLIFVGLTQKSPKNLIYRRHVVACRRLPPRRQERHRAASRREES
ncbi:hypothetical protein [Nostoc sp.]|uniref:hypothetical protein n=1 Tax=Nostoc sp. TaxID=1180 RepID=UPI002FF7F8F7